MKDVNNFKGRAVLFGWISGLLLIICMIWIFSQPLQARYLLRSINNVLINSNDSRRVSDFLPHKTGKAGLLGYWYSIYNSQDKLFVFTVFQDGILVPLGAVVSPNGSVQEIIPLSAHAVQVFDALPKSILDMYVIRIEGNLK